VRCMPMYPAEEYADLDTGGTRTELVRGVLQVREPVGPAHGCTASEITRAIGNYLDTHPIGVTMVEAGYVTERGPDTVRGPDVSFMTYERAKEVKGDGFAQIAPDLAIEVLSPSNTPREVDKKVAEYFTMGARLVWVADPKKRTVTVLAPEALAYVVAGDESLDGGDVLPGFRVEVKKLFGWPPP
jgi:Uma2 family endonuclease